MNMQNLQSVAKQQRGGSPVVLESDEDEFVLGGDDELMDLVGDLPGGSPIPMMVSSYHEYTPADRYEEVRGRRYSGVQEGCLRSHW
jgi:hypothetical protein